MVHPIIFQFALSLAAIGFVIEAVGLSPLTVKKVLSEGLVLRKPRKLFRISMKINKPEPP